MNENSLTDRQYQILEFIDTQSREKGFPPSVREIGHAVGLSSSSTVQAHLSTLQKLGYLRRSDPGKPRAIEVCFDPVSGAAIKRSKVQHVPLVGDVAAGVTVFRQENVEESLPLPSEFTGDGTLFMLRVKGDSMTGDGILDQDYVVVKADTEKPSAKDLVVVEIPEADGTVGVKRLRHEGKVAIISSSNPDYEDQKYPANEVKVIGRVVTVLRKI
tara:strand:- start:189 stop:833 length:645 start_codon:yes stop_codon:yes gene_type:complete